MMKKITILLVAFFSFCISTIQAQINNSGTTVIIGFDNYDNNGLYGLLQSEENGILTVKFFDTDITCMIDNKGNILEGEKYISQQKPGKPIVFIQVYETKKKIANPDFDINKTLGNFMLVETVGGKNIFGISDYNKTEKSFLFQTKPLYKRVSLKFEKNKWVVSGSYDPRIESGNSVAAVYLYEQNTRRFYTRKVY